MLLPMLDDELNKAMSGVKLFAAADVGDCVLVVVVVVDEAVGDAVVVLAQVVELSVLKSDANLLWKEDMLD